MNGADTPNSLEFPETADIDTASDNYATRFSGEVGRWFLEVQAKQTLDLIAPWPGARVLEVGGGHAQLAGPLIQAGYRVTITGSADSCRQRLDRYLEPGSFEYLTCDMLHLPFDDQSFDLVLAFRLLPHVERWPELIAEMCRVTKHAVVLDYPDLRSFNIVAEKTFGAKQAIEKNTRHFTCFTRRQVMTQFQGQGLGRPVFRPQFFWPMALHRGLGKAWFSRAAEGAARALGLTHLLGSPVILRADRLDAARPGSGDGV